MTPNKNLAKREVELLKLILNEHTSMEIADLLNLSIRTVDTHRKNIIRKTKAKSHIGLALYSIKAGYIKDYNYSPVERKNSKQENNR